jgi:hypothetical protein
MGSDERPALFSLPGMPHCGLRKKIDVPPSLKDSFPEIDILHACFAKSLIKSIQSPEKLSADAEIARPQ